MKKYLLLFVFAPLALAQTTINQTSTKDNNPNIAGANNVVVTFNDNPEVQDTPASQALVKTAKELAETRTALDTAHQQAQSALDQNKQSLQKALNEAFADLNAKLKDDKKYKPMMDRIETIQKQINTADSEANATYQQKVGPLLQKLNVDKPLVDGLIPIVRDESKLPANATFDEKTQKWTVPKDAKK
jgi:ABC-type transporter Mla subunit MlaD